MPAAGVVAASTAARSSASNVDGEALWREVFIAQRRYYNAKHASQGKAPFWPGDETANIPAFNPNLAHDWNNYAQQVAQYRQGAAALGVGISGLDDSPTWNTPMRGYGTAGYTYGDSGLSGFLDDFDWGGLFNTAVNAGAQLITGGRQVSAQQVAQLNPAGLTPAGQQILTMPATVQTATAPTIPADAQDVYRQVFILERTYYNLKNASEGKAPYWPGDVTASIPAFPTDPRYIDVPKWRGKVADFTAKIRALEAAGINATRSTATSAQAGIGIGPLALAGLAGVLLLGGKKGRR
jgi:hypothetical protein